jgi:hypothetical protein
VPHPCVTAVGLPGVLMVSSAPEEKEFDRALPSQLALATALSASVTQPPPPRWAACQWCARRLPMHGKEAQSNAHALRGQREMACMVMLCRGTLVK